MSARSYVYRYRVTATTVPSVDVGAVLIDRKRALDMVWHFLDEHGEQTYIAGVRIGDRLCPVCYDKHRKAALYGHPEAHTRAPVSIWAEPGDVS